MKRYSVRRITFIAPLVVAISFLTISLRPTMPGAKSSAHSPAPVAQFCNSGSITINALAAASPYPSTLNVSGMTGTVTAVTVTLSNFNHTFPDDVDILLVGPGGQNAIIMSDAGGGVGATNVTLTLDDAAASNLPDNSALTSGTFKPTNFEGVEGFPAPAPAPSGGSALSVFNGTIPNGVWSLYVADDTGDDGGSISGGWCLDITTVESVPCVLTCPPNISQPTDPGNCGAVVSYPAPTTSGDCGTVSCSPPSGSFFPMGTTTVNCSATGGGNCSFTVTITGTCPSGCNPNAVTINQSGASSPYPSPLTISGATGVVSSVSVTLNSLSHTFPDDIDILLVAPNGQNLLIMSDVGGDTAATGVTLTLTDSAGSNIPDNGPLVSGTFKPTNFEMGELLALPAPAPSGATAFSVFNGSDPNGIWQLYISDDTGGDSGSLAGGWCLNITTVPAAPCVLTCPANISQGPDTGQCGAVVTYASPTTSGDCGAVSCSPPSGSFFPTGTTTVNCSSVSGGSCSFTVTITGTCTSGCNPTSITINQSGAASPYPSPLTISGVSGTVASVTVTLNNLSHTFPDDVDILLVGPAGQNVVLLSDAGGGTAATNVTLTFSDAALAFVPDNGPLVSGTFKPTNNEGAEGFPAPAPAPGGSALNVFNGTNPNGVWQLFVADDTGGDSGSISGGWCLQITANAPTTLFANADSFLRDGADNTNEGANNLLRIQSSGHNRVVVRFDMTGVSTVGLQSATLVLTINQNADNWGPTGRLVDAHRLLADWTEGNGHNVGDQPNFRGPGEGVTWNCAKDSNIANMNDDCLSQWNGGTFAAATAAPVLHTNGLTGEVSWNVTADVLAGATNGWLIKRQNNLSGQVRYYSREGAVVAGNPNFAPRLVLVYAP